MSNGAVGVLMSQEGEDVTGTADHGAADHGAEDRDVTGPADHGANDRKPDDLSKRQRKKLLKHQQWEEQRDLRK